MDANETKKAFEQWEKITTWENRANMDRELWEQEAARAARMIVGTELFVDLGY